MVSMSLEMKPYQLEMKPTIITSVRHGELSAGGGGGDDSDGVDVFKNETLVCGMLSVTQEEMCQNLNILSNPSESRRGYLLRWV